MFAGTDVCRHLSVQALVFVGIDVCRHLCLLALASGCVESPYTAGKHLQHGDGHVKCIKRINECVDCLVGARGCEGSRKREINSSINLEHTTYSLCCVCRHSRPSERVSRKP